MSLLTIFFSSAVLCGAPPTPAQPKAAMHQAFESLTTLVWLTSAPPTPERTKDIERELKVVEAAPHVFDGTKAKSEPALAAVGSLLSSYARQTRRAMERGEQDGLAYRVRTMASLCFACHSRENVPVSFDDTEKRWSQLPLTPLERARLLAATRQFDAALLQYRGLLDGPSAQQATEESLVLLVRVKDDAIATAGFLASVKETAQVKVWREDVEAWKRDKTPLAAEPLPVLIKRSAELIDTGRDVPLLRAAAALTHALSRSPSAAQRGEVLWQLGVAGGALRTPLLWDLDLLYLEACVRENPHTALAKKCGARFEQRLTLGFTGSRGTFIPPDEQKRLDEVKGLSGP
jgi:hypothetical protein